MSDKFTFGSAGLIHELEMGMARAGDWDPALVKLLTSGDHLVYVREYLRGRAQIVSIQVELPPAPLPTTPDTFRVDYSVRATYPDWMKKRLHPEFDRTDTVERHLDQVNLWLHPDQGNGGRIGGKALYQYVKENGILPTCLALRDMEEIRKLGIEVYRKYFRGKAVFGWKDVVQDSYDNLYVSCLGEYGGQVVVSWSTLDGALGGDTAAARFAS